MNKFTAQEILQYMIKLLIEYLEELSTMDKLYDDFIYGEKIAFIECLELIQLWEDAAKNGLDFNIEKKYPL